MTPISASKSRILILDFGSQYTQLIARRVRELHVYCEIFPYDASSARIQNFDPEGIILSGGPESVYEAPDIKAPEIVFSLGCPILGICYGMQTMAHQLGGLVEPHHQKEFGLMTAKIYPSPLTTQISSNTQVWMSHGDQVKQLPPDFVCLGTSENTEITLMGNLQKHWYGVQFHPEVTHTQEGLQLLHNYIFNICHCTPDWTPGSMIEQATSDIQRQVKDQHVLLGLSGGVDSTVLACLLQHAIPGQVHCVFVDTGLLRQQEGDQVMASLAPYGLDIHRVNAQTAFFSALEGVTEPEHKRKIIGKLFIDVFEQAAKSLPHISFLAQGTIYPDVIESAGFEFTKAHVIKSHHNVGGLPERLNFKLLEPLRYLFKDEVRLIGATLGLPTALIQRHPFPGPGLAVRLLGEVTATRAETLRHADAIWIETLKSHGWHNKVSQAFAVLLPVKSVGVKGDQRAYEEVIALRAVHTTDFMTAHYAELPWTILTEASHRIVNEVRGISRVTYDITGKPPATIEWE